jgi:murein DD-endopeptidase MepM/ murein hydrolase activator NlpD
MRKVFLAVLLVLPVIIVAAFYTSENAVAEDYKPDLITVENLVEIPPLPPKDNFGFVLEGVDVSEDRIRNNESLYIILRRYGVHPTQIHEIQQAARGQVNLNRLIPGQNYRVYSRDDEAYAFVWQNSITQYVSISWGDGEKIAIERGAVPIERRETFTAGIISTSLYEAVRAEGASQRLGQELAEIFGWEVNFFALQRGDHFKAIYENLYANGQFIGIGDIQAAEFQHRGNTHRAYFFDNGVRRGYFDSDGNSLQKELLKAPFRYSQRVSSGFSRNRFHPILQQNRPHHGTDYAAPVGTPVISVGDGVVIEAQRRGGNGNIVQIRHNSTYKTAYLHLNGFAPGIRQGVEVTQGQVIGYVGQTGLATGPHLCYRLYVNDQPVNSRTVDLPASDALEEEYLDEYFEYIKHLDARLDEFDLQRNLAAVPN